MPAAVHDRRFVIALAAAAYGGVFAVVQLGHGTPDLYYIPVCLIAIATDELVGVLGGLAATGLYALATLLEGDDLLSSASLIRLATYCVVGAAIGFYANRTRTLAWELRRHTFEDSLTGIGNARAFDEELAARCASGKPFTLVLADVDDFSRLNETHGHEAADQALRRVANALRGVVGRSDFISRVGDDDFALLTSRPPEQTALVCRRIARAVSAHSIHLSFGTTALPDDGTTAVELFRKADDRLFAAKLVSRNRRTVVALNRA